MKVSLPDSLRPWVESQTLIGGHASIDGYVAALVIEERERIRREIDQKLVEGIESGEPIEVNDAFWVERRRVLEESMPMQSKESV